MVSLEPWKPPTSDSIERRYRPHDQTLHNLDRNRPISSYEGVSDVSVPLPTVLSRLPDAAVPPGLERYLQLPESLDPRIAELAASISAQEPNPYLRALAIDRHLSSRYSYTLQLPSSLPADPLANFLFDRRSGHCEYFASSLAVMLRTIGIPSRVITGFRGGQFNEISSNYIIRASNAHSWVEAYIPGAGWTTFDPTPASGAVPVANWSQAQLYLDAVQEFWREWVVNYDAGHQAALSLAAVRQTRSRVSTFGLWAKQIYGRLLGQARRLHLAASSNPRRLLRGGAVLLILLTLAAAPFAAYRLRKAWRARSPHISPRSAASIVYLRMTRFLARRGYRRSPAQTPAEFAASIDDAALRDAVERFTAAYQRARYGESPEQAVALASLYDELRKTSSTS